MINSRYFCYIESELSTRTWQTGVFQIDGSGETYVRWIDRESRLSIRACDICQTTLNTRRLWPSKVIRLTQRLTAIRGRNKLVHSLFSFQSASRILSRYQRLNHWLAPWTLIVVFNANKKIEEKHCTIVSTKRRTREYGIILWSSIVTD